MEASQLIESLTHKDIERIRNSKSDAEARRILKEKIKKTTFIPMIKQKGDVQMYWMENSKWQLCGEDRFSLTWDTWVAMPDGICFDDQDGFTVWGLSLPKV